MINRFRTRCTTCGHNNTLRITIGAEKRQEHTFACAGCGVPIRVALDVDFVNRVPITLPQDPNGGPSITFSQPRSTFNALENCELCEDEGTITNLDPNFLVPDHLLHQDRVFPWMYESRRIGVIDEGKEASNDRSGDILLAIGGIRDIRSIISFLVKAWTLHRSSQYALRDKVISEFCEVAGISSALTIFGLAELTASPFLGRTQKPDIQAVLTEAREVRAANPHEYAKLRARFVRHAGEALSKPIGLLDEYAKAYDQLSQTLIYAIRDTPITGSLVASSQDLRSISMFYGNCFEDLAAGFELPACLNNIRQGRPFDSFAEMTLRKYVTINKANRAKPFADNTSFASLHYEFDSIIRNASHHRALRVHLSRPEVIEYRSGDAGNWKQMPYAEYLLRCNRILLCALRLMVLQVFVVRGDE